MSRADRHDILHDLIKLADLQTKNARFIEPSESASALNIASFSESGSYELQDSINRASQPSILHDLWNRAATLILQDLRNRASRL